MNWFVIQVFSVVMVCLFWIMLAGRILVMRSKNVQVLAQHPKVKLKCLLFHAGMLGLLGTWSGYLVVLTLDPSDVLIFRLWWDAVQWGGITLVGMTAVVVSLILIWVANFTMGNSWRIGVDDGKPGDLVTRGIFKYSRNPIYLGLDVIMIAGFLLQPNLFFALYALVVGFVVHFQIRVEEQHLRATYGQQYLQYCERTPRYFRII